MKLYDKIDYSDGYISHSGPDILWCVFGVTYIGCYFMLHCWIERSWLISKIGVCIVRFFIIVFTWSDI